MDRREEKVIMNGLAALAVDGTTPATRSGRLQLFIII
jgi:hypothetical protein